MYKYFSPMYCLFIWKFDCILMQNLRNLWSLMSLCFFCYLYRWRPALAYVSFGIYFYLFMALGGVTPGGVQWPWLGQGSGYHVWALGWTRVAFQPREGKYLYPLCSLWRQYVLFLFSFFVRICLFSLQLFWAIGYLKMSCWRPEST